MICRLQSILFTISSCKNIHVTKYEDTVFDSEADRAVANTLLFCIENLDVKGLKAIDRNVLI